MSDEKQKGPIQTLRDGPLVVKLWEQQGPKGPYVTATLGRTYRNEQTGEYGESRSLGGADVLRAQALLAGPRAKPSDTTARAAAECGRCRADAFCRVYDGTVGRAGSV